jgi:transposase
MKYETRQRRQWLVWHANHGRNIAATSRQFGISRSTLYRWLGRYDPDKPSKPLRAHSRKPHNKRKPLWSEHHLVRVADISAEHPKWGCIRLHRAVVAQGWQVSASTVGRMLRRINSRCPICNGSDRHEAQIHAFRRDLHNLDIPLRKPPGIPRGHASKKDKDAAVSEAEQIIQNRDWDRN